MKLLLILFFMPFFLLGCTTTTTSSTENGPKEKEEPWEPEKRAGVHVQLARGYMEVRKNSIALTELERALEISPSHIEANHVMAVLQQKMGHPGRAESYFRAALATKPNNYSVNMDFGSYLCTHKKEQEAMDQFQRALVGPFNRQLAVVYLRIGSCMLLHNKLTTADENFRKALAIQPKLGPALYNMAQVQYKSRSYLSARAFIERYFGTGNVNPQSLLLAVKIEQQLGAMDLKEKYSGRLRREFPQSKEAQSLNQIDKK